MALDEFLKSELILLYIFRCRAKLAKRRNRHHLIDNLGSRRSRRYPASSGDEAVLGQILPPRRQWKKLDQRRRRRRDGQPLNSLDKTVRILWQTLNWYRAKEPNAPFLEELDAFCQEVRDYAMGAIAKLPTPEIVPIRKRPGQDICRPVAIYPLAVKIAICLVNKYLSERFDPFFEETSFAFRMPSREAVASRKPTHHDAFRTILEARQKRRRMNYWVAEADIQKFYDTVNHTVLKKEFRRLVSRVNRATPDRPVCSMAIRFFYSYLDSYTFNKQVWRLNSARSDYFARKGLRGCYFGWVAKELLDQGIYRAFNNAKIGVPQGGALSGLIANILLDRVDKRLASYSDRHLIYARYCDDMVLMHRRKFRCKEYFDAYNEELQKLKLLPHPSKKIREYGPDYWKVKSKEPYKWGPAGNVPWVGFVGYEINVNAEVRARKSSVAKEMSKQHEAVMEVMRAVRAGAKATPRTILESVANRLIQMSVGRVRLYSYDVVDSELCWINGFPLINDNKYSRKQMARLDAARNSLLRRFAKALKKLDLPGAKPNRRQRQLIFYGKPFSYYYHVIEKRR